MFKTQKIQLVKKLTEKIKDSPNLAVVNYGNLAHQKLEQLRKKLIENAASFQVVKNTLLKLALKKSKKESLLKENVLEGPSALIFLSQDWLKGLSAFYQLSKNEETLAFKIGLIEEKTYEKNDLEKLAQIPPREQMLTKIVSIIKSPGTNMVFSMRFGLLRLVNILKNKVKS